MFCQFCGAQLPEEARYCPQCGASAPLSNGSQDQTINLEKNDASGQSAQNPYAQGTAYGNEPPRQQVYLDIPDYLVWNIFAVMCCCMPAGIVGLIFSLMTLFSKSRGDWGAALKRSYVAKLCFWISLWGGIAIYAAIFGGALFDAFVDAPIDWDWDFLNDFQSSFQSI